MNVMNSFSFPGCFPYHPITAIDTLRIYSIIESLEGLPSFRLYLLRTCQIFLTLDFFLSHQYERMSLSFFLFCLGLSLPFPLLFGRDHFFIISNAMIS